ncbi:DUF5331 domain-containing protein [Oscillatoria sp. FACHB-1406]|uniref:DUF5331 domain-containing protein n=1 Tax=Oscillatoria sp. FACHB-1406 TaxID=2692846 RepID=UPI00168951CB|nr:DUF5331 domain-containing protein [Oscillatoria sp. FACHB-1406]MBD2577659.1 hypothetical protein [Oscillatoria sp. FACHB-1406]
MMEFLESFEHLKTDLKDKWLDYYEVNRHWIEQFGVSQALHSSEIERANNYYFVLGVLSSLEPSLTEVLHIFGQMTSDSKQILKVLQILDLDVEKELAERAKVKAQQANLIPLLLESVPSFPNDNGSEHFDRSREEIDR